MLSCSRIQSHCCASRFSGEILSQERLETWLEELAYGFIFRSRDQHKTDKSNVPRHNWRNFEKMCTSYIEIFNTEHRGVLNAQKRRCPEIVVFWMVSWMCYCIVRLLHDWLPHSCSCAKCESFPSKHYYEGDRRWVTKNKNSFHNSKKTRTYLTPGAMIDNSGSGTVRPHPGITNCFCLRSHCN